MGLVFWAYQDGRWRMDGFFFFEVVNFCCGKFSEVFESFLLGVGILVLIYLVFVCCLFFGCLVSPPKISYLCFAVAGMV